MISGFMGVGKPLIKCQKPTNTSLSSTRCLRIQLGAEDQFSHKGGHHLSHWSASDSVCIYLILGPFLSLTMSLDNASLMRCVFTILRGLHCMNLVPRRSRSMVFLLAWGLTTSGQLMVMTLISLHRLASTAGTGCCFSQKQRSGYVF